MKTITYQDLQLEIERELSKDIEQSLDLIFNGQNYLHKNNEDKNFFELLKHALEIKEHYAVNALIKRLKENLELDKIELKLFLYQESIFNVSCFPRKIENNVIELQIFVSQHFFNNLNEDEQLAILGHEMAHFLFDHLRFPAHDIINTPFNIGDTGELKSNLIYHSKISEITSDIIGLVANEFNYKAYSTALIKHTTGLSDSANSMFSITPLIETVLQQFDKYAENLFFNDLHSTHPLMPVRVKIINTIAKSRLVRYFGQEVSDKDFKVFKAEYNKLVDDIVKTVYPEIYPDETVINEVLMPMSVAVMLADDKIDKNELSLIKSMINKSHRDFEELTQLFLKKNKDLSFVEIKNNLIKISVRLAQKKSFDKNLIIPIIRKLIIVAASDGKIEKSELLCIYRFAKEFDVSKQDIVLLIKTQYKV